MVRVARSRSHVGGSRDHDHGHMFTIKLQVHDQVAISFSFLFLCVIMIFRLVSYLLMASVMPNAVHGHCNQKLYDRMARNEYGAGSCIHLHVLGMLYNMHKKTVVGAHVRSVQLFS